MRALLFDLDETLIHSGTDFKKMKSMTIAFLEGVGVTKGLLNDRMLNFEIMSLAVEDLRRKGFSHEAVHGFMAEVTKIMNCVELESLDKATIIDGAEETLKALKAKGLKIGILTNGCREYAEKILHKVGLDKYVDAVAARDDVMKPKPNPEHAHHLLRLLEVPANEALLVGDHWQDAECARRSGISFILVRRQDQTIQSIEDPKECCYRIVKDITHVVDVVESLNN